MIEAIFWISTVIVLYIYWGYGAVLTLLPARDGTRAPARKPGRPPSVTVLVTAFNEADVIESKIQNILEQDYPADKLELLVASDMSTDGTDDIVSRHEDERVRLFRPAHSKGKTDTQNQAIRLARGEIIIFTDAETRFDTEFIKATVEHYNNPAVGGTVGKLLFVSEGSDNSHISDNQGAYWKYELRLRSEESRLGILAVASGACMSVRKSLFVPMNPAFGEDCVVPLDVVQAGRLWVYVPDAVAYDRMASDSAGEFRARVRMTLRNWQGTWAYPGLLNPVRNPGYAWALWSHKILRWLSPFFIIISVVTALFLAGRSGLYATAATGLTALVAAAAFGWLADRKNMKVPSVIGSVYSFALANAGFLVGVTRAILGSQITRYGR